MLADMEAYAKLLLPVMCSAAAASGAVTGAGALYMGSSLFFSLLISLVRDAAHSADLCLYRAGCGGMCAEGRQAVRPAAADRLVHLRGFEGHDVRDLRHICL